MHKPDHIQPAQTWEVDRFRPEDAAGVVRLFLEIYGEGYAIPTFIQPDRLIEANQTGQTISSVARTPRGDIVGHSALFRSAPFQGILESGAGLVHPSYRGGRGVLTRLVLHGQEMAATIPRIQGLYGESVCNHVFVQRLCASLGWVTCAAEIDLMPATASASDQRAGARVASLLAFKTLRPNPHRVYLPPSLEPVLRPIYEALDDTRAIHPASLTAPANAETEMTAQIFGFAQMARIAFPAAGLDFAERFAEAEEAAMEAGVQVIQVWLNLAEPWVGWSVERLRGRGYFLGGVLPRWFDRDGLLLQRVLHKPRWDDIRLAFGEGKDLVARVRADWERVSSDALPGSHR